MRIEPKIFDEGKTRANEIAREKERERKPHAFVFVCDCVYCFVTAVIYLSFVKINSRIAVQQMLVHIQRIQQQEHDYSTVLCEQRVHTRTHTIVDWHSTYL